MSNKIKYTSKTNIEIKWVIIAYKNEYIRMYLLSNKMR